MLQFYYETSANPYYGFTLISKNSDNIVDALNKTSVFLLTQISNLRSIEPTKQILNQNINLEISNSTLEKSDFQLNSTESIVPVYFNQSKFSFDRKMNDSSIISFINDKSSILIGKIINITSNSNSTINITHQTELPRNEPLQSYIFSSNFRVVSIEFSNEPRQLEKLNGLEQLVFFSIFFSYCELKNF